MTTLENSIAESRVSFRVRHEFYSGEAGLAEDDSSRQRGTKHHQNIPGRDAGVGPPGATEEAVSWLVL